MTDGPPSEASEARRARRLTYVMRHVKRYHAEHDMTDEGSSQVRTGSVHMCILKQDCNIVRHMQHQHVRLAVYSKCGTCYVV